MPKTPRIVTRSATTSSNSADNLNKGSKLTFAEMDSNFIELKAGSIGIVADDSSTLDVAAGDTLYIQGGDNVTTSTDSAGVVTINATGEVTAASTTTFTNKTFDAEGTGNALSNVDVANLKSGVLDTDISSVSGSDDTLASAKAIKTYVDSQVSGVATGQGFKVIGDDSAGVDIPEAGTLYIQGGTNVTTSTDSAGVVTVNATSDVTGSSSTTFTNKTIDADNNTISNLEVDNIKAATLVTQAEGIGSNNNDTTIPTSAAVKAYADSVGGTTASLGDLTAVGSTLISPSNASIEFNPAGTGQVISNAQKFTIGSGEANADLTTTSNSALRLSTNNNSDTGDITINTGNNSNIEINADGTGQLIALTEKIVLGRELGSTGTLTTRAGDHLVLSTGDTDGSATTASITVAAGDNGSITLAPVGTGDVVLSALRVNGTTLDSSDSTKVTIAEAVDVTGALLAGTSLNIAGDGATVTGIKDEDDMASNSAVKLATQQSIKAYVDATAASGGFGSDIEVNTDDADTTTIRAANSNNHLTFEGNATGEVKANGTMRVTGQFNCDALRMDGDAITSTVADANITITPAVGTGVIQLDESIAVKDNTIKTFISNADLELSANGSGTVSINGLKFPTSDGSANQVLKTDGSGNLSFVAQSGGTALTGSTNNTITTVTGADAIQGEANLTFDGTTLATTGSITATNNISSEAIQLVDNVISASRSNDSLFVEPAGTGIVSLGNGKIDAYSSNSRWQNGVLRVFEDLAFDADSQTSSGDRKHLHTTLTNIKFNGDNSSNSNVRWRNAYNILNFDMNSSELTPSGDSRIAGQVGETSIENSNTSTAGRLSQAAGTFSNVYAHGAGDLTVNNMTSFVATNFVESASGKTITVDQSTGFKYSGTAKDGSGTDTVTAETGFLCAGPMTGTTAYAFKDETNGQSLFGDVLVKQNTISTNSSNADLEISANGSGTIVLENLKVGTSGATVTGILDEDDMSSDSAVKLATQQSIKAYVDANAGGGGGLKVIGDDSAGVDIAGGGTLYIQGGTNVTTATDSAGVVTINSSASGTITALNNQAENRLVSIGSTTTQLDGEANLTFTGSVLGLTGTQTITNTTTDDSLTITTTEDSASAGPVITLKRNSGSPADADYLGQLKFKGENDADQAVNYAKITGKISDASDSSEDGLIEFALMKAGSNNIGARLNSTNLQLLNGTGLESNGNISTDGALAVTGASTLDGVTITDNTVSSNASNANLEISANGTGVVSLSSDGTFSSQATSTFTNNFGATSRNKGVHIFRTETIGSALTSSNDRRQGHLVGQQYTLGNFTSSDKDNRFRAQTVGCAVDLNGATLTSTNSFSGAMGAQGQAAVSNSDASNAGTIGNTIGMMTGSYFYSPQTVNVTNAHGVFSYVETDDGGGTPTLTNAFAYKSQINKYHGTVTNGYSYYIDTNDSTNKFGFYDTTNSLSRFGAVQLDNQSGDPTHGGDKSFIYAKDDSGSSEVHVKDEAGNVTKISPHNNAGEWEYYSVNKKTGKKLRVNMERMIRKLEEYTGESFIENE